MREIGKKQLQIYEFLKAEIKHKGYPPSVREICQAVELNSTATVHGHLNGLERRGYIRRDPTKPRAIEILEPEFYENRRNFVNVPIIGKVTAGEPILATENIDDTFPIPEEYLRGANVFMLRVHGESMVDAGIFDGDLIIVKKQTSAINGDIVVALIGDSATVKTFYKERGKIRLQPENPTMEPIYLREVTILGKVIGLFRMF